MCRQYIFFTLLQVWCQYQYIGTNYSFAFYWRVEKGWCWMGWEGVCDTYFKMNIQNSFEITNVLILISLHFSCIKDSCLYCVGGWVTEFLCWRWVTEFLPIAVLEWSKWMFVCWIDPSRFGRLIACWIDPSVFYGQQKSRWCTRFDLMTHINTMDYKQQF